MWVSDWGETADEPPTPEQMEQWHRRMSPPDNEFPASVGLAILLGRSEDAAVGITQVEAFSTGFRFTLAVRLRQVPPALTHRGLFTLIGSHTHQASTSRWRTACCSASSTPTATEPPHCTTPECAPRAR
ncbi:hypothetical protein Pflav_052510 [Phytohabitans flavus]|uniref:Uncharacterized protein n=1 Tax=Phytohabitans flavus TaxID=1076124 RepID=A0A6F8XYN2_9ACTN|nr:hypothetical protein [Phytohabitans flavus]BCB78841.1 hypothetical protein Pflav_052510 [Phytohabitans flavus]